VHHFQAIKGPELVAVKSLISIKLVMDAAILQNLPELYRPVYQQNWRTIRESLKHGRIRDTFHFPLLKTKIAKLNVKQNG